MDDQKEEVRKFNAMQLAYDREFSRLLALTDGDVGKVRLSDMKKLLYVEDELKSRLYKLLPGSPKVEPKEIEDGEPEYINNTIGYYTKKKPKPKPEKLISFFVKVTNSLNSAIASIPVQAVSKEDAIKVAKKKSRGLGENLKLEVR